MRTPPLYTFPGWSALNNLVIIRRQMNIDNFWTNKSYLNHILDLEYDFQNCVQ